jgi:hypothetical protein
MQQVTQEIKYAVRYARNLAAVEGKTAVLSPLNGSNWSEGIQLQLENEQHILNKDAILYMWKWHLPAISVKWLGFEHQQKIRFSNALNHVSGNGHFLVESGPLSHKITLNRLGRMVERDV